VKRIKDLKTRCGGVHGISRGASVLESAHKFIEADVSALVVYDGEKFVGIFTKNDLVRCCGTHQEGIRGIKVEQFMKRNPYTADIHANLDDVIKVMIEKGFRHVPVLEEGRPVGMVTPIDILAYQKELLSGDRDQLMRYIHGSY